MLRKNWPLLFILFVAFIQYSNTYRYGFAWDDKIVIEENPRVLKGISGMKSLKELFTKYNSQYRNDKYGYRPIVLTSFAFEETLSKKNAPFHHTMNGIFYAITCAVLFIFLRKLFRDKVMAFSLLATLIFVVHPLHVEVVANIKSRDEIFCLLFSLISFIFFLRSVDTGKYINLVWVFVFYVLAYLSKENAFTILGIYPFLFLARQPISWKKVAIHSIHIPILLVLSFLVLQATQASQAGKELTEGLGVHEETQLMGNSLFFTYGLMAKVANALHLMIRYLKLFLIPYPLVFFYGYNMISPVTWGSPVVWISLLLHIGIFYLGIIKRKERPEILFGFIFYIVNLFIYLHLLRPLSDTMADRFMFTPSVGLCILLVGLIGWVFKIDWKKAKKEIKFSEFVSTHKIPALIIAAICVAFFFVSLQRNKVWENDYTLVKSDIANMENSSRGHFYYATQLNQQIQKNPNLRMKLEPDMIKHYNRAIEITDSAYYAYLELGIYYCNHQRFDDGIRVLEKAVKIYPYSADINFFLGQAYVHTDQFAKAVPRLEISYKEAPRQWGNMFFLSVAYGKTGKSKEGLELAYLGLQKFPAFTKEFYDALGHIYYDMGDMDKSVESTLKMSQYGAPLKDVYGRIIGRYYEKGDSATAQRYLQEAQLKGVRF